jgi:hypothetical protein
MTADVMLGSISKMQTTLVTQDSGLQAADEFGSDFDAPWSIVSTSSRAPLLRGKLVG